MRKLVLGLLIPLSILILIGLLGVWWLRYPSRLEAVPADMTARAVIPGIEHARYWVGIDIQPMIEDVIAARGRELAFRAGQGQSGALPPADLLAVSGGGDKGAFGAGLLAGWTETGTRPTFKVVTGVSTGALIAPFAFLGPDYDAVLRKVYTSISPHDVARPRSLAAAIRNDGLADNAPLWQLISKYVDQSLLDAIAAEHEKGRMLLIGTTDLDARQPVIWNMGNIASSGAPAALELFRSILLASAAIPGAFPPSMIPVEVDGKVYNEMHVDGGASTQVFLYPPRMREKAQAAGDAMTRLGTVYVIRNSSLGPSWDPVDRRTISIAGRAIDSLIQTQGIGDLYRIYLTTQRDGFEFKLAYIDSDFVYDTKHEEFETAYMVALFDYGFRLGRGGYPWRDSPPGFSETP